MEHPSLSAEHESRYHELLQFDAVQPDGHTVRLDVSAGGDMGDFAMRATRPGRHSLNITMPTGPQNAVYSFSWCGYGNRIARNYYMKISLVYAICSLPSNRSRWLRRWARANLAT